MSVTDPSGGNNLRRLLAPRSVAILGASRDATRIGGKPIRHLLDAGFTGDIWPVNPNTAEIQGLRAYASITDVPGAPDCAIISLPSDQVVAATAQCAARGVGGVIVYSAGFAEMGAEGARQQAALTEIAQRTGCRVLGPNCVGLINAAARAPLTFISEVPHAIQPGRNIALISQSGGYGTHIQHIIKRRPRLSLGHWVTTGNEADLEFGEMLEAFAQDPDIDVLVGYIEGIRSAENLIRGLEAAHAARKPVIVMKVGGTRAGAAAAASHTASLAGADSAYRAVFADYGVHWAHSTEEVIDVAYAVTNRRFPLSRAVCIVTNTGGLGVQLADFAAEAGLDLPEVPAPVQRKLLDMLPYAAPRNPVDITAQLINDPSLLGRALEMLLGEAGMPAILAYLGPGAQIPSMRERLLASVRDIAARYPQTALVLTLIGPPDLVAAYEETGCLVFDEPLRAVRSLATMAGLQAAFLRPPPQRTAASGLAALGEAWPANEHAAKHVLLGCGIAVPDERLVADAEQGRAAAQAMRGPFAVKIVSAAIAHKTEIGGVALGLADADAVARSIAEMTARVQSRLPGVAIDGFLVTPMLRGGVECIIGAHSDPVFGPQIMFGLGGTSVELLGDVAWARAPLTEAQALDLMRQVKAFPLLDGYRGRPKADLGAIAAALAALSRLALANAADLDSIEINPLLALPEGAVALDALFVRRVRAEQ